MTELAQWADSVKTVLYVFPIRCIMMPELADANKFGYFQHKQKVKVGFNISGSMFREELGNARGSSTDCYTDITVGSLNESSSKLYL